MQLLRFVIAIAIMVGVAMALVEARSLSTRQSRSVAGRRHVRLSIMTIDSTRASELAALMLTSAAGARVTRRKLSMMIPAQGAVYNGQRKQQPLGSVRPGDGSIRPHVLAKRAGSASGQGSDKGSGKSSRKASSKASSSKASSKSSGRNAKDATNDAAEARRHEHNARMREYMAAKRAAARAPDADPSLRNAVEQSSARSRALNALIRENSKREVAMPHLNEAGGERRMLLMLLTARSEHDKAARRLPPPPAAEDEKSSSGDDAAASGGGRGRGRGKAAGGGGGDGGGGGGGEIPAAVEERLARATPQLAQRYRRGLWATRWLRVVGREVARRRRVLGDSAPHPAWQWLRKAWPMIEARWLEFGKRGDDLARLQRDVESGENKFGWMDEEDGERGAEGWEMGQHGFGGDNVGVIEEGVAVELSPTSGSLRQEGPEGHTAEDVDPGQERNIGPNDVGSDRARGLRRSPSRLSWPAAISVAQSGRRDIVFALDAARRTIATQSIEVGGYTDSFISAARKFLRLPAVSTGATGLPRRPMLVHR
jgi:hypothetical protein